MFRKQVGRCGGREPGCGVEGPPPALEATQGQISSQSPTDLPAFEGQLTKETINLPLGCLEGGDVAGKQVGRRGGRKSGRGVEGRWPRTAAALEATQGQMDGSIGELPYKCHLEEVASVGD